MNRFLPSLLFLLPGTITAQAAIYTYISRFCRRRGAPGSAA
jgi:hypothetical protein